MRPCLVFRAAVRRGLLSSLLLIACTGEAIRVMKFSCCQPVVWRRANYATALNCGSECPAQVPARGRPASAHFTTVKTFTGQKITLLTGAEQDQLIAELVDSGIRDGFGPQWPDELGPAVRVLSG